MLHDLEIESNLGLSTWFHVGRGCEDDGSLRGKWGEIRVQKGMMGGEGRPMDAVMSGVWVAKDTLDWRPRAQPKVAPDSHSMLS